MSKIKRKIVDISFNEHGAVVELDDGSELEGVRAVVTHAQVGDITWAQLNVLVLEEEKRFVQ